jgi:Tetracyclin repressor-like, C-terminal domain
VACLQGLIEEEMTSGSYEPPVDPATLAYALVRLRHAFLWDDATSGVRGDYERLREVQAALLGVPARGRARLRLSSSRAARAPRGSS